MFSIKLNTSLLEGTLLTQRDSMSLLYDGEEISNFTEASKSEQTMQLIREKIEQLYPFIKVSILDSSYGFCKITLTTPDRVITRHSVSIPLNKIDISRSDYDFESKFNKIQDFLEKLNQGVMAFVYQLTLTPESLEKEIQQTENKLDFLKAITLSSPL